MTSITPGTLFLTRRDATLFLRALGVKCGAKALEALASVGGGPNFRIIRGKALYTEPDLLAWLNEQPLQSKPRPWTRAAATHESE
jgi:hypothetical protein